MAYLGSRKLCIQVEKLCLEIKNFVKVQSVGAKSVGINHNFCRPISTIVRRHIVSLHIDIFYFLKFKLLNLKRL